MKRLRKVLPNTQETRDYLDTLPKIYLVVCWVRYGVLEFPFTRKYKKDKFRAHKKVPLVYQYDDHNGTDDSYYLRPITYTTTGAINSWTLDRDEAYRRAEVKNREMETVCCPNCGKEHPRVYNMLFRVRGCSKSMPVLADELGFCNVQCLLEYREKMNITEQND